MEEHIIRKFVPENDEEEKNIHNIHELIQKMDGCLYAHILGEGDYHFIEATFMENMNKNMINNIEYLVVEQNHGLHEPVVNVQINDNIILMSLCDECNTCPNTACYDIEKLQKHLNKNRRENINE